MKYFKIIIKDNEEYLISEELLDIINKELNPLKVLEISFEDYSNSVREGIRYYRKNTNQI